MSRRIPLCFVLAFLMIGAVFAEESPQPADTAPLIVVDSAGKEQKLKTWRFTSGVRRLSWLVPAPAEPEPDKDGKAPKARPRPMPVGPEALEFREENSTPFVEGIQTLIPLDRLRTLEYDAEKDIVTARVAASAKPDDDAVLTGLTKYQRVNKLAVDAEVDKGDLGVAEVRYLGGVARGVRAVRFPSPKATEMPAGRPVVITTAGKDKSTHKVADLQALYRLPSGHERLLPLLMFKKTLKLDLAKIKKITTGGADDEEGAWQVQLKDGGDETLSLLRVIPLDGKETQLAGLLGRVPAGYKLFPVHTLAEVLFDATEPDAKPEK